MTNIQPIQAPNSVVKIFDSSAGKSSGSIMDCYHNQHTLMKQIYKGDVNIATITEIKKNISAISVFQTLVRQAAHAIKSVIVMQG
jgi:hypothetical protein